VLFEKHRCGQARLLPIIIRPCDWVRTEISSLQALPKNGRPVVKWRYRDDAYVDIMEGIRKAIGDLTSHSNEHVQTASEVVFDPAELLEPEGALPQSYVYTVGIVEPRFPNRSVRKEFEQAVAGRSSRLLTDGEAFTSVLKDPAYWYLARDLCWVFVTGTLTGIFSSRVILLI